MSSDRDDAPLWRQIADQLRSDIADEVYAPGSPLPGEVVMADRYQTSRPTVRRAISELAGEGLLTAAHGRGTFVRSRPDRRTILIDGPAHADLLGDEYDLALAGWVREDHPDAVRFRRSVNQAVADAIVTSADRDQAEALHIKTGTAIIYRFEYWRHQHSQRVISVTSITPSHLLGIFNDQDEWSPDIDDPADQVYFDNQSISREEPPDLDEYLSRSEQGPDGHETRPLRLYPHLATHYGPVSFATTVTARMPRGDELNDLGMDTGTPILHIQRTMTDAHQRPLEATIIEAAADRFDVAAHHDGAKTPGVLLNL